MTPNDGRPPLDLDAIRRQVEERNAEEAAKYEGEGDRQEQVQGFLASLDLEACLAAHFVANEPPTLEWTFKDSLLVGNVGFICGPPGAGKSTFLIQLAGAVATGVPLFGDALSPARRGKVLSLFCEEDRRVLHHRVSRIFRHFNQPGWNAARASDYMSVESFGENFFCVPCAGQDMRMVEAVPGQNPRASNVFHDLLALAKSVDNLALIILDPLSRLYGSNENDNSAATLFSSLLERLAVETGASVICAHHVSKNAGSDGKGKFSLDAAMNQDALRGASALTGACRWQFNLFGLPGSAARRLIGVSEAEPGQYLAARVSKKNYGPPEGTFFLERKWGGALERVTPDVQAEQEVDPALEEWVMAKVKESEAKGSHLTVRMLRDFSGELKEIPGATARGAEAAASRLLFDGKLFEVPAKNRSGRTITRLSTEPPDEDGLVDTEQPDREPDRGEPVNPVNPVTGACPVHNHLDLQGAENRTAENRAEKVTGSGTRMNREPDTGQSGPSYGGEDPPSGAGLFDPPGGLPSEPVQGEE
jgi:RecA-family ATPase